MVRDEAISNDGIHRGSWFLDGVFEGCRPSSQIKPRFIEYRSLCLVLPQRHSGRREWIVRSSSCLKNVRRMAFLRLIIELSTTPGPVESINPPRLLRRHFTWCLRLWGTPIDLLRSLFRVQTNPVKCAAEGLVCSAQQTEVLFLVRVESNKHLKARGCDSRVPSHSEGSIRSGLVNLPGSLGPLEWIFFILPSSSSDGESIERSGGDGGECCPPHFSPLIHAPSRST